MGELTHEPGHPANPRPNIPSRTHSIMNPSAKTTRPLLFPKPWAITCGLVLALGTLAPGQSAKSFDTKTLTPAAPAAKKEKSAAPSPQEPVTVSATPSRYVGEADLAAHVESLASMFAIRGQATDPFGQLQDPNAKPIVKTTVAKASRRIAPIQATPFSDIVRLLQVTTIMPKEKRFLVGTRSIKQGDSIPLAFRGKNIRVEVTSVSSSQIDFRNLESNETASLKLNLLPVGMTPGTRGISAPGMVIDRPNSPIELDPGNIQTNNSQNR